jgi:hypothetical protein
MMSSFLTKENAHEKKRKRHTLTLDVRSHRDAEKSAILHRKTPEYGLRLSDEQVAQLRNKTREINADMKAIGMEIDRHEEAIAELNREYNLNIVQRLFLNKQLFHGTENQEITASSGASKEQVTASSGASDFDEETITAIHSAIDKHYGFSSGLKAQPVT